MKKSIGGLLLLAICLFFGSRPADAARADDIAARWAPVICQRGQGDGLRMAENTFTLVNYDRDWRLNNNWYNLLFYPPRPAMYYSVVESDSHYFLGYYQYYPRHTGSAGHEHDLTGVLAAVRKTPEGAGQLDFLLTYTAGNWHSWQGSRVRQEGNHPVLNIYAASHELTAAGRSRRALPATALYPLPATTPAGDARGGYQLVPFAELWEQRQDIGQNHAFARWGYFDSMSAIRITAPWVWEYRRLNWLTQPGELVQYFQGRRVKACTYLMNPYQTGR